MTLWHRLSSIVCAVAIAIGTLEAQQLPTASPQSQGLAPERLERLHAFLTEEIDAKHYSGAVLLVARNGRVVDWRALGLRDCEAGLAMEKDTIVRIYSMSKIVTTVAAMLLVEDGRIRLDDPVEKYLPALAKMRVWTGGTEKKPVLVPAKRPITIKHLLTHTSGFIYGFGNEPIDKRYQKADPYASSSMDVFVAAMARLPLAFQPGDKFGYGSASISPAPSSRRSPARASIVSWPRGSPGRSAWSIPVIRCRRASARGWRRSIRATRAGD
jgi:CubicO group peptidase (beta-lactamase class C family)